MSKILDQFLEEEEEEPVSELLEKLPAKAKKGDIYQLDNHRLMCGDSTDLLDVKLLTEDRMMNMVWTDPPYNVNYKSSNEKLGSIENDNMTDASFREFSRNVFVNLATVTRQGGVFYVCTGWQSFATFEETLTESGIHIYDVWEVDRKDASKYVHPTEKPDWLVMKALKNSTKFKDNVIDLFGGSGSCLMACEKLGRNAYLMELDPRFVDVIIYRWEKYTGKKAKKI